MADNRSADEVAGGFIRVLVGGSTRELPTLKIRDARAYRATLFTTLEKAGSIDLSFDLVDGKKTFASLRRLTDVSTDTALDLLLEYDKAGTLGGRQWLEDHADDTEIHAALLRVVHVILPLVDDLRSLVQELLPLMVQARLAGLTGSSSTSGPSTPGAAILPESNAPSTKSS